MANKTSVKPGAVRARALELGITEGLGKRGRVSREAQAKVLAATPAMLKTIASELGVSVSGLRGSKRAEKIQEIVNTLV